MSLRMQQGFTLFETLVAVFVIAVGVLCTAKMQQAVGQSVQHASYHATAAQIGASIADNLRAGSHSVDPASYMKTLLANAQERLPDGKPVSGKPQENAAVYDCYRSSCSAAELAQADIETWRERMRAELPGGQLRICRDAHPWDEAKKEFRWECAAAGNAASASLVIKIGWRTRADNASSSLQRASDPLPAIVMTVAPFKQ